MSRDLSSYADVIELWPTAVQFGLDIGVPSVTARSWKHRGIPAEYWEKTVAAARARNLRRVSIKLLARLAAKRAGHAVTVSANQPHEARP